MSSVFRDLEKPIIPPDCWYTQIDTWHRVRTVRGDDKTYEIGQGNTPLIAAGRAWGWYQKYRPAQFKRLECRAVWEIIRTDFLA